MKRYIASLLTLLTLPPSLSALGVKWEVETTNALPYDVKAFHGETFTLEAVVKERGAPLKGAATVTFYYQTPDMASHEWYTTGAQWSSESATCRLAFTPALDIGHTKYRFFFGIETAQGKNYRAFGTLRLKPSPGFNASILEPVDIRETFKKEILAEVLQSLESTFAPTVHAHDMDDIEGLQAALDAKQAALTAGENITIENGTISAAGGKITVDTALSSTSTNPVQNKVVKKALDGKASTTHTHTQYADISRFNCYDLYRPYISSYGSSMHTLRTVFNSSNEVDNWAEKFDNAKITFEWWHQYSGIKEDSFDVPMSALRALANGGGGAMEIWKGNVGFGEQDTFIGAKKTTDGDGQFLNGYPRLHNHGQDIHEVSGFSRDSRDDETVWSHRLLLPWDLAKANDTSYLMAGVVWEGNRNLIFNGDTTTFVQPLVPTNKGNNTQYLPYAIPAFENSPMFWKGQILWHDGKTTLSKSVIVPWDRVTGTTANPTELALKRDVDGKQDKLTAGENITIENGVISAAGGGGASIAGEATGVYVSGQTAGVGIYKKTDTSLYFSIKGSSDGGGVYYVPTTAVTDALTTRIDALESGGKEESPWVSPGDWMLTVRSSEDYATVSTTEVTTATQGDRVMGETTVTTHASPIKDVSVEMLDLSMPSAPIPVTFTCEGVTLTPSSSACRASATTEGLYRIFATDAEGRTRDAYLNLRTKTKATTTKAYLSDVEGSARKAANDVMLSVLAARDRQATVAVGQTSAVATCDKAFNGTTPLASAPLAPAYFCMVEPKTTWGPDAVAVAPHFAVTAAHWQPSATKTATFVTPAGETKTVSGTYGIALTDWARAKGYSASEIDEADIDDLYVWHFTTGTIPDACIPYVMDRSVWDRDYNRDLSGILSYTITQNGYLSFAPLLAADGSRYSFGTFNAMTTRADMLEHLAPACCATIYGGDSGRPILMIHEEKPVLLSTFWTAGSGPSLISACEILDAFIRERSAGTEALKRVE